jgi:hypothetical protein
VYSADERGSRTGNPSQMGTRSNPSITARMSHLAKRFRTSPPNDRSIHRGGLLISCGIPTSRICETDPFHGSP